MKGLILNNFYSMEKNIKFSFVISLFIAFISFGLNDDKMISMIISMQILVILSNVSSSLKVDESSKWNKMEITLPVKRNSIITAKYFTFIVLIILGLIFSLLTPLILSLKGVTLTPLVLLDGYSYGLSLAIGTVSILYPLILKFGTDKGETMLLVSAGVSIAIRFCVWIALYGVLGEVNFNGVEVGLVTTVVSVILFVLSYMISIYIHKNKSF